MSDGENVKIYLAGNYDSIDWDMPFSSELGKRFILYDLKKDTHQQPSLLVKKKINDEYSLRLIETKRYILKIEGKKSGNASLPRFMNEGNKFFKCEKDKDYVLFQFVNYLGMTRICFDDLKETLVFEVIPEKIDYEDDYVKLTEAIAEHCSELLLDHCGLTSNVFSQAESDKKTLLEQFIFLRKFCYDDNLQGLFEAITRNPDRVLDQEEEFKPFGTGVPSKKYYCSPQKYGKNWARVTDGDSMPIFPQMIATTRKYDMLDTPANRFIKFALHKIYSVCEELEKVLIEDAQNAQTECLMEARAIRFSLERIFKNRFFEEVGELDIMPQNNQVLQKREGYSQIFFALSMLDLALQLDWQGKDDVFEGESKNVALLYEYWLFFELYRIIISIDGCVAVKTTDTPFLQDKNGLSIQLKEGEESCQAFELPHDGLKINLYYNKTFSHKSFRSDKYEGSYSRPFRPDYSIALFPSEFSKGKNNGEEEAIVYGAVKYLHFDAKYRITDLTSLIGDNTTDTEEELIDEKFGSVVNTYKRGDLLKMHTYVDAIRRSIGSFILYPGSQQEGKPFRLFDEILPGVGAFALKPSIENLGEAELKAFITDVIKSVRAENSRINRLKYYSEMIISEPSCNGVVSLHTKGKSICLGDLFVIGYIKSANENSYYRFLKNNGFLEDNKEFLFYCYAIKGKDVYSHHKDLFKAHYFRFYTNQIEESNSYLLEPGLCSIISNELVSRQELVDRLKKMGFATDENDHHADFYYVMKVKVIDSSLAAREFSVSEVNSQHGNDTFSPHSPKVMKYAE